jgi:hypothetical protein
MSGGDDVEAILSRGTAAASLPGAVVAISTGGKLRTIVGGSATADTDEPVERRGLHDDSPARGRCSTEPG